MISYALVYVDKLLARFSETRSVRVNICLRPVTITVQGVPHSKCRDVPDSGYATSPAGRTAFVHSIACWLSVSVPNSQRGLPWCTPRGG